MRIHDSLAVKALPSFKALMVKLKENAKKSLRLTMDSVFCDGLTVLGVRGSDVYHWPEFKDFCRDLEVPHEMLTKEIRFDFKENHCPTVTHVYNIGRVET